MKKVLFISGSGGHSKQLEILISTIGHLYSSCLMLENDDLISLEKFKDKFRIYTAIPIRGKNDTQTQTFLRVVINFYQSLFIFFRCRPEVIITTGPGLGIPICIISKIFKTKLIVIESWSRTSSKSIVGRILYNFADLFFIQWPEMKELFPKAKYAGRFI